MSDLLERSEPARLLPPWALPPPRTARVLVLGGTGRVGGSTAAALSKLRPDLSILVKGRNRYPPYPTDNTSLHHQSYHLFL
jgi:hypothetical protein